MMINALVANRVCKIICAALFCPLMMMLLSGSPIHSASDNSNELQKISGGIAYGGIITNSVTPSGNIQGGNSPDDIDDVYICAVVSDAGGSPDLIRITGFAEISHSYETLDELESMVLSASDYLKNVLNVGSMNSIDTMGSTGSMSSISPTDSIDSEDPIEFNISTDEKKGVRQAKASFAAGNIEGSIIFQSKETQPEITGLEANGEYICNDKPSKKEYLTAAAVEINMHFCSPKASIKAKASTISTEKYIWQSADRSKKIKDSLYDYFNHNYKGISISTTYRGVFFNQISNKEMDAASDLVFDRLGGNATIDMTEKNFISKSGYSPFIYLQQINLHGIKESLKKENSTMNINVALRYNGYEDKSYMWIGIPVICADY